jgi:hypothetical protein
LHIRRSAGETKTHQHSFTRLVLRTSRIHTRRYFALEETRIEKQRHAPAA